MAAEATDTRLVKRAVLAALALTLAAAGCDRGAPAPPAPTPTDPAPTITPTEPEPEVLEGTYRARIPRRTFTGEFSWLGQALAGRWTLRFQDSRFVLETQHFRVTEDYEAREDEFQAMGVPAPEGAYNCFGDDGGRIEGSEPVTGTYEYELSDDAIEFRAMEEPCPVRALYLERRWRLLEDAEV